MVSVGTIVTPFTSQIIFSIVELLLPLSTGGTQPAFRNVTNTTCPPYIEGREGHNHHHEENLMKGTLFTGCLTMLLILGVVSLGLAGQPQMKHSMKAPSIEGTYMLISRKLPDGTTLTPPNIMGLQTFTNKYRNFNVFWKDNSGKVFSYSVASTYKLTRSGYTETLMFGIMNDQIGGKQIDYNLSGQTKTAPIEMDGKKIEVKLPFDPPSVVFDGNKLTATAEGMFVDYWEKVK
jgi:hypothetical protein